MEVHSFGWSQSGGVRPPRASRGNIRFLEDASPRELRFVAFLCERAAARFESDAKALTLHFAFVRKVGESVAASEPSVVEGRLRMSCSMAPFSSA
jgi:hypothetical protein